MSTEVVQYSNVEMWCVVSRCVQSMGLWYVFFCHYLDSNIQRNAEVSVGSSTNCIKQQQLINRSRHNYLQNEMTMQKSLPFLYSYSPNVFLKQKAMEFLTYFVSSKWWTLGWQCGRSVLLLCVSTDTTFQTSTRLAQYLMWTLRLWKPAQRHHHRYTDYANAHSNW